MWRCVITIFHLTFCLFKTRCQFNSISYTVGIQQQLAGSSRVATNWIILVENIRLFSNYNENLKLLMYSVWNKNIFFVIKFGHYFGLEDHHQALSQTNLPYFRSLWNGLMKAIKFETSSHILLEFHIPLTNRFVSKWFCAVLDPKSPLHRHSWLSFGKFQDRTLSYSLWTPFLVTTTP